MTPPLTSSLTSDATAAAKDTDAEEGTCVLMGDTCTTAAPVTQMATVLSATDHTAAANDGDAAEGMSASTGDSCTHVTPVTPVATPLITSLAATTTLPWTSSSTTAD